MNFCSDLKNCFGIISSGKVVEGEGFPYKKEWMARQTTDKNSCREETRSLFCGHGLNFFPPLKGTVAPCYNEVSRYRKKLMFVIAESSLQ